MLNYPWKGLLCACVSVVSFWSSPRAFDHLWRLNFRPLRYSLAVMIGSSESFYVMNSRHRSRALLYALRNASEPVVQKQHLYSSSENRACIWSVKSMWSMLSCMINVAFKVQFWAIFNLVCLSAGFLPRVSESAGGRRTCVCGLLRKPLRSLSCHVCLTFGWLEMTE